MRCKTRQVRTCRFCKVHVLSDIFRTDGELGRDCSCLMGQIVGGGGHLQQLGGRTVSIKINLDVGEIKPDLNCTLAGAHGLVPAVIRNEAIAALQAPVGVSKWPVASGLSKSSFDADIRGDTVVMTNATTYAKPVEKRTGAAEATLRSHFDSADLAAAIRSEIQGFWDGQ